MCTIEISAQFDREKYRWRLRIVQNFRDLVQNFCIISGPKLCQYPQTKILPYPKASAYQLYKMEILGYFGIENFNEDFL